MVTLSLWYIKVFLKEVFKMSNNNYEVMLKTINEKLGFDVRNYDKMGATEGCHECDNKPNPFDNRFIRTGTDMTEGASNKITTETPVIQHESYLAAYTTALDLCLQGIISPSTLGIDVKKLDNSEAQREKEKATLYTRQKIVNMLDNALPKLVDVALKTKAIMDGTEMIDSEIKLNFGEYANPSFESQVETIGKAKTNGIMSTEASIDELYGDSKDENWKKVEVRRIKEEQGIAQVEEPSLNLEGVDLNEI
jgi:hypothetical protein